MNKKNILLILFLVSFLYTENTFAQKYWVKFKNKNGTPYTTSNPGAFLSAKSIARRTAQGISVDNTDLPVTPTYVSQVDAISGVTVLYRSKWLNGIAISVTNTTALTTINSFSFVQTSTPVNYYKVTTSPIDDTKLNANSSTQKSAQTYSFNYGSSLNQAQMIGADCMHNLGFRGQGMTIAVLDAGFLNAHIDPVFDSLFLQGRLKGCRDFVMGDTLVFEDNAHGAMCLSTMAGIQTGTIIGTAPKANYWLLRTEDAATETPSEEYNWLRGIEFADSVGADISTTSLGYTIFDNTSYNHTYSQLNGKTSLMSIAATMAARKGMIVLNAAGNEGCGSPSSCWYYIGVPADADSIITVGSVDPFKNKSGFSSFGPTSDGRIKPDLVAQGGPAWVCNQGCFFGNGTSFATPVLAGAIACYWQSKPTFRNMQVIQTIKQKASNFTTPNNSIGWGVPNMCASYFASVNEIDATLNLKQEIVPNPFSNTITVNFNIEINNATLTVYDVYGKVVLVKDIIQNTSGIRIDDLSHLSSGLYFINTKADGINATTKIVKQ